MLNQPPGAGEQHEDSATEQMVHGDSNTMATVMLWHQNCWLAILAVTTFCYRANGEFYKRHDILTKCAEIFAEKETATAEKLKEILEKVGWD